MEILVVGFNTLFVWSDKSYNAGGSIETLNITDDIKTNKNTIIMGNGRIDYGTVGRNITSKSRNQTSSMILFGTSNYGNTPTPMGAYNMRVYDMKIYEDEILKRHYVPCYCINDDEIGLYELEERKFYSNNGTEIFLKGANIIE